LGPGNKLELVRANHLSGSHSLWSCREFIYIKLIKNQFAEMSFVCFSVDNSPTFSASTRASSSIAIGELSFAVVFTANSDGRINQDARAEREMLDGL
jgi:hypothetical protein